MQRGAWVGQDARTGASEGTRRGARTAHTITVAIAAAVGIAGCSKDEDPSKAWSALAHCLAGKAADTEGAKLARQVRLIEISQDTRIANENEAAWPQRCAPYANRLYKALPGSGKAAVLHRALNNQLGCQEGKDSCTFAGQASTAGVVAELWEATDRADLELQPTPDVPSPRITARPAIESWTSFVNEPAELAGSSLTRDGRLLVLLKKPKGRNRPRGCEFTGGLSRVTCIQAHEQVPAFPPQSIRLVDAPELIAAGLTEDGRAAYTLKAGERSEARGSSRRLVHNGVAVERGEEGEGYIAVVMSDGKAGKAIELETGKLVIEPVSIAQHVVWVESSEDTTKWMAQTVEGNRLQEVASYPGSYSGWFHTCRSGDTTAVGTWGRHEGQHEAKPTVKKDGTRVTVSLLQDGEWSKPEDAVIPFDRSIESPLVCSDGKATLAWGRERDDALEVGRLDCTPRGCQATNATLKGVRSKLLWTIGPVGDKVALVRRSRLGDARLRVAPLQQLPTTEETLLFDSPAFGGPKVGEAEAFFSSDAALLLFEENKPVALHVSPVGSAKIVTGE